MNYRIWLVIGSLLCAFSVAMGAFAAHALKASLDTYQLSIVETGARYQMYHGFAILITATLGIIFYQNKSSYQRSFPIHIINTLFLVGVTLFSGSLYLLALFSLKWVVYMTPLGGVCFIIGWVIFAVCAYKMTLSRQNN